MLVISPWARENYADHSLTNQASILVFIEDNWLHGRRLGKGSFDGISNSITGMFNFDGAPRMRKLILNGNTGEIASTP
jgi:phospholipase C